MTRADARRRERARLVARVRAETHKVVRRLTNERPPEDDAAVRSLLGPIAPVRVAERSPTIVLLNDCRDQVNFGAQALVDGLVTIVQDRVPEATIVPVPSYYTIDTAGGLGGFVNGGAGLRQPRARYPRVADEFEAVADDWMAGRGGTGVVDVLRCFEGADLVVLNGEGSIYRTNLSAIRELFLAWLAKVRLGIPTAYVNGGIHLTGVVPVLPAMVRKTFGVLDAVAVREPASLRNLEEYAPSVDAHLFPDSAFVLEPGDAIRSDAVAEVVDRIGGRPYFCFDPGPMPMDTGRGSDSAFQQLLHALVQQAPVPVFVNSAPADSFIEPIARDTGSIVVDTLTDYREFMALAAGAAFLITGRYHNPILAAIAGCPSITLASTNHKVHGACEMLDGIVGWPYDGTYLRPEIDTIVEHAHRYVRDRVQVGARLHEVCATRRAEVMGLGDLVASLLPRPS